MKTFNGFDISRHQGLLTPKALATIESRFDFGFLKASEGVGYQDPCFHHNYRLLQERAPSVLLGAYHFARVSKIRGSVVDDAAQEANWFSRVIDDKINLPVLDLEWDKRSKGITPKERVLWAVTFLERVQELTAKHPMIYTGRNFWRYKLGRTKDLQQWPLWLVQYRKKRTDIEGWPTRFWQYSSEGSVEGIRGPVDLNYFYGSGHELQTWFDYRKEPVVYPLGVANDCGHSPWWVVLADLLSRLPRRSMHGRSMHE